MSIYVLFVCLGHCLALADQGQAVAKAEQGTGGLGRHLARACLMELRLSQNLKMQL